MSEFLRPEILDEIPSEGHVAIEAAAGTGKTFALENLVLDMLLAGRATIPQILIVTYTEPATAELKRRVRTNIERLLNLDPVEHRESIESWGLDAEKRMILQSQLDAFGRASIHTIHGFCHRVLHENAFHLRRLFDEQHGDGAAIFETAFKRALRREIAVDPVLRGYLVAWLQTSDLSSLSAMLSDVVYEQRVEPRFSETALGERVAALREHDGRALLRAFHYAVRAQFTDPVEIDLLVGLAEALVNDGTRAFGDGDFSALLQKTNGALESCLEPPFRPNLMPRLYLMRPETADAARVRDALIRLVPLRAAVVQSLLGPVRRALEDVKGEGVFDYDDMLRGVWDRMSDPGGTEGRVLVEILRRRYRAALIDEFQDTDPIQWNIFRTVFFESEAAKNRLVVIGDPKQAIYGFRGADVHTYLSAKSTMLSAGDANRVVHLRRNYRSTQALIDAYNTIFDQAAEEPFFNGEIVYDHPVECGEPDLRMVRGDGSDASPVHVVQVVPAGEEIDSFEAKRTFGRWIALEIRRLLDGDLHIEDPERGRRGIEPDEIRVLVHTNREARLMGRFLREAGVRFAYYKEEGLFQTPQARHILELLQAIDDPYPRSNRFRAWATPFFDVPYDRLAGCSDLPDTHPLMALLLRWRDMGGRQDFDRLFDDILESSGVLRREILVKPSERELTNYLHIFEVLLEEAHQTHASLADLIVALRQMISRSRGDSGDRNVQRLETDKAAVQIMTIHKSKGLEADVVFLFGGLSRPPQSRRPRICHVADERIAYLGPGQTPASENVIEDDSRREEQRLLYVALTRARARLYLPFVPRKGQHWCYRYLTGTQLQLNQRLAALFDEGVIRADGANGPGPFEVRYARVSDLGRDVGELNMPSVTDYGQWEPTVSEPQQVDVAGLFDRPWLVSSYSRIKRTSEYLHGRGPEEFAIAIQEEASQWRDEGVLPGGADSGSFLHELFEHVDFRAAVANDFDTWATLPQVRTTLARARAAFGVDSKYDDYSLRTVHRTLNTPMELPNCRRLEALGEAPRELREVEFFFPIPEAAHARFGERAEGARFVADRGFLKGYIDLVFEWDGRVFFADWKSDQLASYADAALEEHVANHYETQAWLYSLALAKIFGIESADAFEERFGGYAYIFVRGLEKGEGGVFARRPTWQAVREYEATLQRMEFL